MSRKMLRFVRLMLLVGCMVLGGAIPAMAEDFATPSLDNILRTLVRFGAVDIRDDKIIDLYGRITECGLYNKYYADDFKWQRIRKALRESIKMKVETFPTGYKYDTTLQLDRYDFKEQLYRFTDKTAQFNVNVFTMVTHIDDFCVKKGRDTNEVIPLQYKLVLDQPVQMKGIPMSQEEGKVLLERLRKEENKDRLIYARFNMRIVYVAPVAEKSGADYSDHTRRTAAPMVTQDIKGNSIFLDSRLDSIEYYEDEARTKLIYIFRP